MTPSIELISSVDQLSQGDLDRWNELAKNPLQRWEWLGSWWRAYQGDYRLCIVKVRRQDETIAFVPWCLEIRVGTGKTIQFLGSGKACTDHLSLLVSADDCDEVCAAVAGWLARSADVNQTPADRRLVWDSIELIGVDREDPAMNELARAMRTVGLGVEQTEGLGCYAIKLPPSWDEYVRMRSKSGRREVRQALKNIDSGAIVVQRIECPRQLDSMWDQFVSLHQRRRHAAGTTGCFDHPPFEAFLRDAASRLLDAGLLELIVATNDGVPVAAHFAITDKDHWYFYQSGMDPDAEALRPGLSMFCHAIRESIVTGRTTFDMMRGDEPYKLRWRAELMPAQEIRVCSPRPAAQLRNQVVRAGVTFKNLVKSGLGIGQPQT
ncbi:GNAT family N-acetyltransferase [Rhodopirellula sp. JC639]|uniref:GNAT family N-acetyltransferase n=1 Tax=Stieleria mannarensis TaxID=2755585 RepID=UPI0016014A54|nr:GNAT family N-acetyltransferase [Rhodopirellula sp. JC639]